MNNYWTLWSLSTVYHKNTDPLPVFCVFTTGNSPLAAEYFMLSVDQTIVNGHINAFTDALVLMFATYYCLNISYPEAQGATLEFLQR